MKKIIKISVRNLVELIMRQGSIDNRYQGSIKAIEGIKAHQKIQKLYKDNDSAEVFIKHTLCYDNIDIEIEGRIDGVLTENEKIIIDEIKTTTKDLLLIDENTNPLHIAQAKCYGYIYSIQNSLEEIDIQLTYYNIENKDTRIIRQTYSLKELDKFFYWLIDEYIQWAYIESQWIEKRNESLKKLKFPFEKYRPGQREFAIRVFKSIANSKKCFAQAPTGTGKTISTLFPALKSMGEEQTSKIFYLTAKTITREVAQKTIELMRNQNISLKSVTITAKEKICKMEEVNCNPEYCPYAKGYYDRINSSLKDILQKYNDYGKENIEKISEEYRLCPFELSLDLTLLSDVIICDYNYVFDPRVYLKRFFDVKSTDFTFLIDEGHNLVDRAREMYSKSLSQDKFISTRKILEKKDKKMNYVLKEIEEYFLEKEVVLNVFEEETCVEEKLPLELCDILHSFVKYTDEYLSRSKEDNKELLELYFEVHGFLAIADLYDSNYTTIYKNDFSGVYVKLYCVNPSKVIVEKIGKSKSTTIFSATLIPMDYFKTMYGANEEDYIINLRSPFDVKNRLLMIANNIQTTYNMRKQTSGEIANYIINCIECKKGNYMVFFPSYKYMKMIYEKIEEEHPNINIIIQENNMSEEDKEAFLARYYTENNETHIGFCVLGGHFSEGIDLAKDNLIGVIIVGVGMPQIGVERDIIKENMNAYGKGFDYAYVYPGMIKVLQAAGRCIRTEEDKGVILLLDNRYSQSKYQKLFPYEWYPNINVRNSKDINIICEKFWNE